MVTIYYRDTGFERSFLGNSRDSSNGLVALDTYEMYEAIYDGFGFMD
jgi:hypothetical protein